MEPKLMLSVEPTSALDLELVWEGDDPLAFALRPGDEG